MATKITIEMVTRRRATNMNIHVRYMEMLLCARTMYKSKKILPYVMGEEKHEKHHRKSDTGNIR